MHVPETEVVATGADGAELFRTVLIPGEYVVGRDTACELPINAGLISPKHALLTINFDHALIEDLGSGNGTFVNERPVKERTRLWPNQKIQIGAATLELHRIKTLPIQDGTLAPTTAAVQRILPEELLREKKYDIGGVVARGGMGAILDAKEAAIERKVAMKVMLDSSNPDDLTRFVAEAKITGQLEHPNIVPVHELGVDENGQVFYTMKFVRGVTLRKVLELMAAGAEATIRKYPLAALLTVFQKVCDAVAFAHSKSVIHRDLKPENIMLGDFGEVLLMDWGLAKLLRRKDDATAAPSEPLRSIVQSVPREENGFAGTVDGSIMGTPQFMAPEQARGEVDALDARTDIYALGAILFDILLLRPPISGRDVHEVVDKAKHGRLDWTDPKASAAKKLSHLPAGSVPNSLMAVCRKALSLDPAGRYPRVASLQKDVAAYQAGFATSAENAGLFRQIDLALRRHKKEATILTACFCLLVAGGVFAYIRVHRERDLALAEKALAEKTLAELRGTAPTFAAQANALVDAGKLDGALAKLGYAIQLDPKNPAYQLQRAHLLEAGQHLADAAVAYREVLGLDPQNRSVNDNLALCERLRSENGGAPQLRRELQVQLVDSLVREGRAIEAGPLAAQLGKGSEAIDATLRARLKEYSAQPGWKSERIGRQANGTFYVSLDNMKLGDLSILQGMPISALHLSNTEIKDLRLVASLPLTALYIQSTQVTDLSPLGGLKLEKLYCSGSKIIDIEPLRGMPLRNLGLDGTRVSDLAPLAGMPLEFLALGALNIKDLAPLRGMPLRQIDMQDADGDMDMAKLSDCRNLEEIVFSQNSAHIESLRGLPKLARLRVKGFQDGFLPAEKFWAEFNPRMEARGDIRLGLRNAGVNSRGANIISSCQDGSLEVHLGNMPVSDLNFLHGLPVSRLAIFGTKVHDLSPLRGLPLEFLNACNTTLTDLEPLRGLPLTVIGLQGAKVASVAPLRDCPTLESILLPKGSRDVESLRHLPKLRLISYEQDLTTDRPTETSEQFWKEYDENQAAQKK